MNDTDYGVHDDSAPAEEVVPETPVADDGKDEAADQPEEVGVQTGGLAYTPLEDGFRSYPEQGKVETVDDPTPTPEVKPAE